MRYGFVKVCAATPEMRVADVNFNTKKIIEAIKKATANGAQLVVFPELSICGYTCADLFNQSVLIKGAEKGVEEIVKSTAGNDVLVFIGAPVSVSDELYNCAVAISNGKILGVVPKTYVPNYSEFYERRNFSGYNKESVNITYCGEEVIFGTDLLFKAFNNPEFCVAAEICEDLWAPQSPSISYAKAGAKIIVNLSCSDETVGKADYRRNLVGVQSAKLICGYVYCDAGDGESSTDMTFAGHNIIAENGKLLKESELYNNGLIYGEIDVEMLAAERRRMASTYFGGVEENGCYICEFNAACGSEEIDRSFDPKPFIPSDCEKLDKRSKLILTMQAKGLEKRLLHTGAKTAVIGISGGLDSALALLVTRRAFLNIGKPLEDIIAITMPGFGTTGRTKNNSLKLISLIGATAKTVPIGDTVLSHFKDIEQNPETRDVTYENAQARMRTMILMNYANKTGGLVVGTGDLSELALGWATYNGDHMSMYNVNCSVPKTLVKHLVKSEATAIGGECGEVLNDILATEISPELLPPDESGKIAQKTEDLVGPYELHDFFLYNALRFGFEPEKVKFMAIKAFKGVYDSKAIEKWLKKFYTRFFAQQFKRSCSPDGVKVGSVTLSPRGDWRMPSDAICELWLKNI